MTFDCRLTLREAHEITRNVATRVVFQHLPRPDDTIVLQGFYQPAANVFGTNEFIVRSVRHVVITMPNASQTTLNHSHELELIVSAVQQTGE